MNYVKNMWLFVGSMGVGLLHYLCINGLIHHGKISVRSHYSPKVSSILQFYDHVDYWKVFDEGP